MKKLKLVRPTPEEDAAINEGIAADPDTRELSDAEFDRLRRPRGRPKVESVKVLISLRLDPDVLDAAKATGGGWQTRINDALRRVFVTDPGVLESARRQLAQRTIKPRKKAAARAATMKGPARRKAAVPAKRAKSGRPAKRGA